MPEYAVKPERRKLVALGFFVAIAVAVGMVLVLEKLFGRVQGMTAVTALTGQRPMVVVPYITTAEETRSLELLRKRVYWGGRLLWCRGAGDRAHGHRALAQPVHFPVFPFGLKIHADHGTHQAGDRKGQSRVAGLRRQRGFTASG
jgi:hypothetical protein